MLRITRYAPFRIALRAACLVRTKFVTSCICFGANNERCIRNPVRCTDSPDMFDFQPHGVDPRQRRASSLDPSPLRRAETSRISYVKYSTGANITSCICVSCGEGTRLDSRPTGRSEYERSNGNTQNGTNRLSARERYKRVQRSFLPILF